MKTDELFDLFRLILNTGLSGIDEKALRQIIFKLHEILVHNFGWEDNFDLTNDQDVHAQVRLSYENLRDALNTIENNRVAFSYTKDQNAVTLWKRVQRDTLNGWAYWYLGHGYLAKATQVLFDWRELYND